MKTHNTKQVARNMEIRGALVTLILSIIVTMVFVIVPVMAWAELDGCGDGGSGSQDIESLVASFNEETGDITVELTLCEAADDMTKYRVHYDHTAPFATDPDRNGDGNINDEDFCVTTSDDTMMHRGKRDTGPGEITVDGNLLIYVVSMSALSPDLSVGDTIFVWADTHYKGIRDRAPDTDASDECSKPEVEGEFVELVLSNAVTSP